MDTTTQNDQQTQDLQQQLDAAQYKIKQLNRAISVIAGRLDVVDQYIAKADSQGKPVDYEFKYFVTKSRKNMDDMLDRLSRGEPAVE